MSGVVKSQMGEMLRLSSCALYGALIWLAGICLAGTVPAGCVRSTLPTPAVSTPADQAQGDLKDSTVTRVAVKSLSHKEYPDNPDIPLLSADYGRYRFGQVDLIPSSSETNRPKMTLRMSNETGKDSAETTVVEFRQLDILHFLPTIPKAIRDDTFLSSVAVVNQEWNRQQVKFELPDTQIAISDPALAKRVHRVDLARNCLRSGLWEVFLFEKTIDGDRALFHGWFDFPMDMYAALYQKKNKVSFDVHSAALVQWQNPPSDTIRYERLRSVISQKKISFNNLNDALYPLKGERKKKAINIVYPKHYSKIEDFLTDETQYATFAEPGFYTRADPRPTTLSLLRYPVQIVVRQIETRIGIQKRSIEIEVAYRSNDSDDIVTRLTFGGLDFDALPILDKNDVHRGFQMPMGIANHSFYETYAEMTRSHWDHISYYGLVSDGSGHLIDSHGLGIDGPLLFRDKSDPSLVHLYLLSFERHSFVGHYTFILPDRTGTLPARTSRLPARTSKMPLLMSVKDSITSAS